MDFLPRLISEYGLILVFVWVLVEQLGVPIPAFPLLVVAGAISSRGELPMASLVVVSVSGCLISDYAWYLAGGKYGSRVLRLMCKLSLTPDTCVTQTHSLFGRWGAQSLIVAKFVPGFASISTAMAGAFRVNPVAFLFYDVIGAALWSGTALFLGWKFSFALGDVLNLLGSFGKAGVVVLAIAFIAYLAWKLSKRLSVKRYLLMPRIAANELQALLGSDLKPILLDARKGSQWAEERIPGSVQCQSEEWKRAQHKVPRQSKIIVYCDCPDEASAVLVTRQLRKSGFQDVYPLLGGLEAWRQAGLSTVSGRPLG